MPGVGGVDIDGRLRRAGSQRMGSGIGEATQRGEGEEPFGSARGLEFLRSYSPPFGRHL